MRKGTIYKGMTENDIVAIDEVQGYIFDEIGVHKENNFWYATHLQTGVSLTPYKHENVGLTEALNEAIELMAMPEMKKVLSAILKGEYYKRYCEMRKILENEHYQAYQELRRLNNETTVGKTVGKTV